MVLSSIFQRTDLGSGFCPVHTAFIVEQKLLWRLVLFFCMTYIKDMDYATITELHSLV